MDEKEIQKIAKRISNRAYDYSSLSVQDDSFKQYKIKELEIIVIEELMKKGK